MDLTLTSDSNFEAVQWTLKKKIETKIIIGDMQNRNEINRPSKKRSTSQCNDPAVSPPLDLYCSIAARLEEFLVQRQAHRLHGALTAFRNATHH
ncbi:unnamed protein product [Timema podura]|uniref:Uncharacterized protein n=1 Tax=Timema podura TaxID=61482 RepID=A0ABN7NYZ3_TIMPD|nr:unnamed protein product [Timema podura]